MDTGLLNYIRFVADIITFKKYGESAPNDDFEMLNETYSDCKNRDLLSEAFDVWKEVKVNEFFTKFFSNGENQDDPLRVNIQQDVNLLSALSLSEKRHQKNSLAILMWGVVTYLLHKEEISEHDFRRRIRTLRNLLWHSADEQRKKRMKQIIDETERLIRYGVIDETSSSFNKDQKKEEAKKLKWLEGEGREQESKLAELENKNVITGSTQSISIDAFDLYDTFIKVFGEETDFVTLTRAFLSCGDARRKENDWRYLIPGKSKREWKNVFEPGGDEEFRKDFPTALRKMLEAVKKGRSLDDIISGYLAAPDTKKDWRYYMVKYPAIIENSEYGKYFFPKGKAYLNFFVMKTETRRSGRHDEAILWAIKKKLVGNTKFENDYGGNLIINMARDGRVPEILKNFELPEVADIQLSNKKDHFELRLVGQDGRTDIPVDMVSTGVDAEDRVEKIVEMLRLSVAK